MRTCEPGPTRASRHCPTRRATTARETSKPSDQVCRTWRVGDRVWIAALGAMHGTYAERIACDAANVFRLPDAVAYGGGAALGVPAATAHRALFGRANGVRGESVLVHGATGAVGLAAVQLAKAAGLQVLATAGSDQGLDVLRREGADAVFNHHDAGRVDAIKSATNGKGVDVVLEMLANVNLDVDLGLLAPRGRVVVIGSRGRVEIDPRQTMGKDAAILGDDVMERTGRRTRADQSGPDRRHGGGHAAPGRRA